MRLETVVIRYGVERTARADAKPPDLAVRGSPMRGRGMDLRTFRRTHALSETAPHLTRAKSGRDVPAIDRAGNVRVREGIRDPRGQARHQRCEAKVRCVTEGGVQIRYRVSDIQT